MTAEAPKPKKVKRIRTPTRLQMEATECGAASLAIVLEHYGTFVPLSKLREECGVSRDGSKASNVIKAARKYDLEAKGYRKEPHQVTDLTLPVIVHWNFNHFLVVEGFDDRRAYLNDPAAGPTSVPLEEFNQAFTGVVLSFKPTEAYRPKGRRPSMFAMLARRLAGSREAIAFIALAGLCLLVPGLVVPVFGMVFVDEVLVGGQVDLLSSILLAMSAAALLRLVLTYLQRTALIKLVARLGVKMATGFLWHALRLPIDFYLARSAGDLADRVRANDAVAHTLSGRVSGIALDLVLVAFYALFMLYIDPWLTLIGFATAAAYILLLRGAERARTDLSRQVVQHHGKLHGVASGGLQMIETIKGTGSETEFFGQWAGYHAKLLASQQALARRDQLLLTTTGLVGQASTLLVLSIGALRVMDGHMSLGMLVAFQTLMAGFLGPIESLSHVGASLQQLRGDLERLDDVLEHEEDTTFAAAATEADTRRLTGELDLKDVTFGYLPLSPPLVSELTLHLSPGQRVALVGGSGSGKSTVARLVCGLYRPWSGEIVFDGTPREALPRSALTTSVAIVDQEVTLFEGTVRENLTLWDDTIPEADVVQAAKDACIHDVIAKLPGGYDGKILEGGVNFSGGQRQRLEIARALVRQPAIVVLDEATSALDPETEQRVDANLRRRGCSCLIIAHRLSTIRDADEIIVLDRGVAVQRGSHEALMAEGGLYHELITTS
ncbi:MAG: NHLP family bacteriocin export ABC transporter peptidase/permease/ATPase subunit [Labilithrix sp.]|nr:NHLP family bacteriocin export ABC transporter peptidase/permease/ATPase subunit [Labilithrix sp.]MCW5813431.1 NHLP family bacteriocin export ABC transporter peptidase/permease/ATPase subunit [Labilithrix sp.]